MRLKIEVLFKIDVWNSRFLLTEPLLDWTKAVITDQGLDRIGDSYWISGLHIGSGDQVFTETSNGLSQYLKYSNRNTSDKTDVVKTDSSIVWTRDMEHKFKSEDLDGRSVNELSLSWDEDPKTATALLNVGQGYSIGVDEEFVITCRVSVSEDLNDIEVGEVDFGASIHTYTIKPCFYKKFDNTYIGSPLTQKVGRVYSGEIPVDQVIEPVGSIDTNLAVFNSYTYETRSRTFSNFFTLSSPNAVTRTVTSHTFGIPSAFGVQFDPPIDKDFNRELTLNFKINWDRG